MTVCMVYEACGISGRIRLRLFAQAPAGSGGRSNFVSLSVDKQSCVRPFVLIIVPLNRWLGGSIRGKNARKKVGTEPFS